VVSQGADRVAAAGFGFSWECWRTAPEDDQEAAETGAAVASVEVAVDSEGSAAGAVGAAALREAGST
jgi:hypothetical protein